MGKSYPNGMRSILIFYSLLTLALPVMAQSNAERKAEIQKKEAATPSQEALDRRARSVAQLKKEGVPVSSTLPVIEDSTSAKTRTVEEVAKRAIAVCLMAVKGEGLEDEHLLPLVKEFGAEAFLSPEELAFLKDSHPSQADRVKFTWRYENYWVLLWALGYVDSLNRPEGICDVKKSVSFILKHSTTPLFIKNAKLRPLNEILDQADLIYRYHWAVVDARLKGKETPANLEGGVVMERHYVLNWLIGYMDQEWDDISTDT